MARRVLSCAAAAFFLVASVSPAAANENKKKAGVLFRQGNKLFAAKKLEEALAKFRAARELFSSYKIDLNIASALSELGRLAEAAHNYEGFLRKGWEKAPPSMVKGAREKLDELKAQLGIIELKCEATDAAVTLDGKMIGRTPLQERIYVKPGPHQLAISKAGHERHLETLVLAGGQVKELAVTLKAEVVEPTPQPEPKPEPTPVKQDRSSWGWKKTTGWVALGVGVVGLVTGSIFAGLAGSKKSEYDDQYGGKTWQELESIDPGSVKRDDLTDQFDRHKTGAIVGFVLGGVGLAAGTGLLLWHYLGDKPADTEQAQITPLLGPGVVGAASTFRF